MGEDLSKVDQFAYYLELKLKSRMDILIRRIVLDQCYMAKPNDH